MGESTQFTEGKKLNEMRDCLFSHCANFDTHLPGHHKNRETVQTKIKQL